MPEPTAEELFAQLPDLVSLPAAARACHMTQATLRAAIKAGELAAFIPRGREPGNAGRGQGYRITRADLTHWYFKGGV